MIALLRRRVTKVVCCYAMNVSLLLDGQDNSLLSSFGNIAGLFGCMDRRGAEDRGAAGEAAFNHTRHVFPSEHFPALLQGLRANIRAGRPASFLLRTRALPKYRRTRHLLFNTDF